MGYDSNVIQAASRQLEERRSRRETEFAARQAEIYAKIPRTAAIDRQLRATISAAAAAALRKGTDPAAAIAALKEENLSLQREREQLLRQAGYAPDALVDQPVCPLCRDTGWRGAEMCACLRELCAREQIHQLSSLLDLRGQSFDSFRLDVYSDEPEPNRGISPRQNMQMVYALCKGYAQEFPNFYFKNLFLTGDPGLGKTFLSASIAGVVAERGYSVVYDTVGNVFAQFEARKFEKDPEAQESTLRYLHCDLLILDDLGSEMKTSFTQSALYEILNFRLVGDRCTVISSNLTLERLKKEYTPQIYSRIAGEYRSIAFFGADVRQYGKNNV
ncbi:MAG: ATP-binding protein [Oscillospiraceae bacterium]|nr:ATP-binding protein [Oscillospiraceae bacterium]